MSRPSAATPAVRIFTSMGTLPGVADLAAAYEVATGCGIDVAVRLGPALTRAIADGEPGDIVANFTSAFPAMIAQGQVVDGSVIEFARAGVGVSVQAGAPRPDIATPEAFRAAMLAARSIGYSTTGSGLIAAKALESLGILDAVRARVRHIDGAPVAEFVARGEVEVGMQQTNALRAVAEAHYLGPLPGSLQEHLYFSVGLLSGSERPEPAHAFMRFMASPEAAVHLRKGGMEPLR